MWIVHGHDGPRVDEGDWYVGPFKTEPQAEGWIKSQPFDKDANLETGYLNSPRKEKEDA